MKFCTLEGREQGICVFETFMYVDGSLYKTCTFKIPDFDILFKGRMFIRDCYDSLFSKIFEMTAFFDTGMNLTVITQIIGSPDLGKSVFGWYLLWTLMLNNLRNKKNHEMVIYYCSTDIRLTFLFYSGTGWKYQYGYIENLILPHKSSCFLIVENLNLVLILVDIL
jgi:hypothetical protein